MTVYTGWRGLALINNSPLRFTDEGINIPLAVEIDTIHAGIRTDSVYKYGLVIPDGTFNFPLTTDITSGFSTTPITSVIKTILTNGIGATSAVGGDIDIYRGDIHKYIQTPWIKSINIKGSSGQEVTASVGIRGIWGYVEAASNPVVTMPKARALMFNELTWGTLPNLIMSDASAPVPREFSIDIQTGIVDDNSYNTDPRKLRGFAVGPLKITGSITCVGGALNTGSYPHINQSGSGEGNFIPWTAAVSIGGLYTLSGGIWHERTIMVPGMGDISVTQLSFTALFSLTDAGGDVNALPISAGAILIA